MKYKNLFFDLDDTLWDFTRNARESLEEAYQRQAFHRFFTSFEEFYALYKKTNLELWREYGEGRITKEELNAERFRYPLRSVGVEDNELAERFSADFFSIIPTKSRLMPHVREVLRELAPRYNLYILSNGFRELQFRKMESAGIKDYFKRVILSEDIGLHKPRTEIFHFALSATQSETGNSLMIGDNWDADIVGARDAGICQAFYNVEGRTPLPFRPTYELRSLLDLLKYI